MAEHSSLDIRIEQKTHRWLWLSFTIVVIDQTSKLLAEYYLVQGQLYPVAPFFNLTLLYNPGAAFSLLSEAGGWQRWFFIIVTVVVCGILWSWLKRFEPEAKTLFIAVHLVLGGAVGNLLDRLFRGEVVDFLDVYYQTYHWPAFNVADTCITLGALIIISMAVSDKGRF